MAADSTEAKSASVLYEEEAQRWEETGLLQASGSNDYAYLKLGAWLISSGAKAEGVSERLRHYYAATQARFERRGPDWFDNFLSVKDWCSLCGETFRLENLSLCTHCDVLLGYCHQSRPHTEISAKCALCHTKRAVMPRNSLNSRFAGRRKGPAKKVGVTESALRQDI